MYDQQFEFLDMLAIVSFALQMEFFTQHGQQPTNAEVLARLDTIEQKLDKLLETVA